MCIYGVYRGSARLKNFYTFLSTDFASALNHNEKRKDLLGVFI